MAENKALMLGLLGVGAYYLISTMKGSPTFRNMQGQAINEIRCGNSVTFDVPGYTRVWLNRAKDGNLDYNQPFDLPMPPYVMSCSADVGVYDIVVYEIDANGNKGALIGQTKFTVLPNSPIT